MNVCFSRPSAPNEILDVAPYKNYTIEELAKVLKLSYKSFFIKTPFYCEKLENGVCPFIIYPDLILQSDNNQKYPIPEKCLLINEHTHPKYSLFVLIDTQLNDIEFPLMEVKFTDEELSKLNSNDFLDKCIKTFNFQCYDSILLNSNQEIIEKSVSLKKLFDMSKNSHLIFKCNIADSEIKNINKRKHIIKEIINSEIVFVNNMQVLHNYWHPTFSESEMFDCFQLKLIFQEIDPILKTHVEFLQYLTKLSKCYSSEIGPLFLNYIDRFKVTIPFISNYKRADSLIQKMKYSSKNIEKKMNEIESKSPMKNGGDFSSYYITPVQRYPRYTLLIRELERCTPSFHPDKSYLELAEEALIVTNKEIDETSQQIKQQLHLGEIQKALPVNFPIINKDRVLIIKKKITIQRKLSSKKGVIYLFNDMVLVVQKEKKKLKPILFDKIEDFRFFNGLPSNDSFLLSIKSSEVTISFKNYEKKSMWMEQFDQVRMVYLSTINCDSKFIKWTEIEMGEDHVPLMNLDGCFMNDKAYFFGGMNSLLIPCSALIEFDPEMNNWHLKLSHIPARIGHTMTTIGNKSYVCFGFNKKEYFSDIWEFDGNKWKSITLSEKIRLAHHTTICHENKLVVFGGKNEKGISNELLIIDPKNGNVSHVNSKNAPLGRVNHSAVYYDGKMVIIGGETKNSIVGDVIVYDFAQNSWQRIDSVIVKPRKHHRSVVLEDYIFIIGGVNNDKKNNKLANECIDPLKWKKIDFHEFGNSPFGNSKFALAPTSKTSAITYGGIDSVTKMPLASSWMFDIKEGFENKN